jgi:hypothetical protein
LNYSNSLWMSALNLFKTKKKKKLYNKMFKFYFNNVRLNFYYSFFFQT